MTRLVRAELRKLFSTQVWFWLLLGTVGVSVLVVVAVLADDGAQGVSTDDAAQLFSTSALADVVVFVLGVLGVTTEFRYQTITPTFLQTPSRWAVVTAKMITYAVVGVVYGAIAVAFQLATAVPWFAAAGSHIDYGNGEVVHALIGVLVVVALYGIVGLGVGALLKNQIVAVVVGVVFLLIIETLLHQIPYVRVAWPYTPDGAADAILRVSGSRLSGNVTLLPLWAGVLVLLAWAFVPAIIGASFTMTRDIT